MFPNDIVKGFHAMYKGHHIEGGGPPLMRWRDIPLRKCPSDLWIYQELICHERPDLILEGGTCAGGSALFMADICSLQHHGRVITLDWDQDPNRPRHERITYITGDTLSRETFDKVLNSLVPSDQKRMLILDDGHDQHHVYDELMLYMPLLNPGDILIVEDTDLGGPLWGLERYQAAGLRKMEPIEGAEKFLMTFNPKGYWRVIQ